MGESKVGVSTVLREPRLAVPGERKLVTALHVQLDGTAAGLTSLDPQTVRRTLGEFHAIVAETVEEFAGTIARTTDTSVLALFGAPQTHEDDAERACYAALMLLGILGELCGGAHGPGHPPCRVHIGLDSGELELRSSDLELPPPASGKGRPPSLAAGMQPFAPEGGICVTEHTVALVRGLFALRSLGELPSDGTTVRIFGLESATAHHTRFEAVCAYGFSDLVGRTAELQHLDELSRCAQADRGQAVAVVGPAGVGKTRLCHEFATYCVTTGVRVLWGQGFAQAAEFPFTPFLRLLRDYFGLRADEDPAMAKARIADRVLALSPDFHDILPLLFMLLGATRGDRHLRRLSPEELQSHMFFVLRQLLHAQSLVGPTVLIVDDIQSFDSASTTFLNYLAEGLPDTRLLLVATFRPDYAPEFVDTFACTRLDIAPLPEPDSVKLLHALLGDDPTVRELGAQICERTAGNPLFMEEVVHTLRQRGDIAGEVGRCRLARTVDEIAIPATVQALLLARIDRLEEAEKQALYAAAVIGAEFSEPVIAHVLGIEAAAVRPALDRLVEWQFIVEGPFDPGPTYRFKHPLIHEVAYETQTERQRQTTHLRAAQAIQGSESEDAEATAGRIAHHLIQAGPLAPAADVLHYARVAGDAALRLYALREAAEYFEAAQAQLQELPGTEPQIRGDVHFKLMIAVGLLGDTDRATVLCDDAIAAFETAQCDRDADRARFEMGFILNGHVQHESSLAYLAPVAEKAASRPEALYLRAMAEHAQCLDYTGKGVADLLPKADYLERHARRLRDPVLRAKAICLRRSWYGNHSAELQQCAHLSRRLMHMAVQRNDRRDEVLNLANLVYFLFVSGRAGEAATMTDAALKLATQVGSPAQIVNIRAVRAICHCFRGEWVGVEEEWELALPQLRRVPGALRIGPLLNARLWSDHWLGRPQDRTVSPGKNYSQMTLAQTAVQAAIAMSASEEDPAGTEPALRALHEHIPAIGAGIQWLAAAQAMTIGWANVGRAAEADRWYDTLQAYRGMLYFSPVTLDLARVAALNHRWEDAFADLTRCIRHARREGLRPLLARALYERAATHLVLGDGRRRALGRRTLEEAHALFDTLGMGPWVSKAERLHQSS